MIQITADLAKGEGDAEGVEYHYQTFIFDIAEEKERFTFFPFANSHTIPSHLAAAAAACAVPSLAARKVNYEIN